MLHIILIGAEGRMGRDVSECVGSSEDVCISAYIDKSYGDAELSCVTDAKNRYPTLDGSVWGDLILDFSNKSALFPVLDFAKSRHIPVVIASTGHSEEELSEIGRASNIIPVFKSDNFSVGVYLLSLFARLAATVFSGSDVEILESHHRNKCDIPSGTSLSLADSVISVCPEKHTVIGRQGKRANDEIGISSLRFGFGVGSHEIIFSNERETLTLHHDAHSRRMFSLGALNACRFIVNKSSGLYGMADLYSGLLDTLVNAEKKGE